MEAISLKSIATMCAGQLTPRSEHVLVHSVSTDSRRVRRGDVFFAIAGEHFDGHNFVADAIDRGAAAVVLDQAKAPATPVSCPFIAVDNTRLALGRLAAACRKSFHIPLIAIAGSNGKTTTKDLVAAVLRRKFVTLSSEASFNNDIGVPLTLLRLQKTHQTAVLETGTNHPGELAPLVRMIAPTFGVLTNLGREHLEFFGDMDGVVDEESRLGELLPADGALFLNGDGPWAGRILARTRAKAVRVGFNQENDWRVAAVQLDSNGTRFQIETRSPAFAGEYHTALLGKHQALNAAFAVAIGAELGLSRAEIQSGLAECRPPKMRLELIDLNGVRILNDAYNANADSMLAALETLSQMPCGGRRIAVLGDMAELGRHTEAAHEEIGRQTALLGIGQLFAVGRMAPATARAARAAGLNRVLEFADVDSAAGAVKSFVRSGDLLLLKASRAVRLERVAEVLRKCSTTWANS